MNNRLDDWLTTLSSTVVKFGPFYNLQRLEKFITQLPINHFNGRVITVAGTNGKGSVVAILEAMLLQTNHSCGVYTSPHLIRFNERMRLNGKAFSDDAIADAYDVIASAAKSADVALSYFEYATLAFCYLMQKHQPDYIILEVGVGGRLDAVNIVDADIAIITSIGLDHQAILGNTREAIAVEKAGIMRIGRPVISGDANPPSTIAAAAAAIDATLYQLGRDFSICQHEDSWDWQHQQLHLTNLPYCQLGVDNSAVALQAMALLQLPITMADLSHVLQTVTCIGRCQAISGYPCEVLVDVGHNAHAIAYLVKNKLAKLAAKRTFAVVSMLDDKDIYATLAEIFPLIDSWYIAPLTCERAASTERMQQELTKLSAKNVRISPDVRSAFYQALADAKSSDRVIVFGSFYTVSCVLK